MKLETAIKASFLRMLVRFKLKKAAALEGGMPPSRATTSHQTVRDQRQRTHSTRVPLETCAHLARPTMAAPVGAEGRYASVAAAAFPNAEEVRTGQASSSGEKATGGGEALKAQPARRRTERRRRNGNQAP